MKSTIVLLACLSTGAFAQSLNKTLRLEEFIDKTQSHGTARSSRTQAPCVADSSHIDVWQTGTSSWFGVSRTIYGYDWLIRKNSSTHYNNNGSTWNPDERTLLTFNGHNDVDEQVGQVYSANTWQNNSKDTFSYDAHHNELDQRHEAWNPGFSIWQKQYQILSTYDSLDNRTSNGLQLWNSANAWENAEQYLYTFIPGTNTQLGSLHQLWTSGAWQNKDQDTYSYDIFGRLFSVVQETWNPSSPGWLNRQKYSAGYSGANLSSVITSTWDAGASIWKNASKVLYAYDSYDNTISETRQIWNTDSVYWDNALKFSYTYNTQNKQTGSLTQLWQDSVWQDSARIYISYDVDGNQIQALLQYWKNNAWVDVQRNSDYYNCTTVGISENPAGSMELQLYPNPASVILNIKTDAEYKTVLVIDLCGKEVLKSDERKELDVSGLEKGIYFIQLFDKNNKVLATEKFIKD